MATPKRDNQKAARVLVDAALHGDRKACEIHKITDRTLRNYRAAIDNDTELSSLYAQLSRLVTTQNWADELNTSLTGLIRKLGTMVQELPGSTAENISAVTGAIKVLRAYPESFLVGAMGASLRQMMRQAVNSTKPKYRS